MTDVITLLTTDHREVDSLFERVLTGGLTGDGLVDAVNSIIHDLSVHASAEEVVLYPAIRDELADGERLADEAIEEHSRVEKALKELDGRDPAEEDVALLVARIAAEVRHHVEEEEGDLFERMRVEMSAERLDELGERLERAKAVVPTRPHPSAPDTPPGNLLVGPPTGLIDRLRDAISR